MWHKHYKKAAELDPLQGGPDKAALQMPRRVVEPELGDTRLTEDLQTLCPPAALAVTSA